MPVDLNWLGTTGWLDGDKATVKIPQSVLRELVDEVKVGRGEQSQTALAKIDSIIDRVTEILKNGEGETKWLAQYTLRLMQASLELNPHLERISSKSFGPRVKFEVALRDE
jgi:hypothetical protein